MNDVLPEGLRILEGRPFLEDVGLAHVGDHARRLPRAAHPYLMDGSRAGEDVHRVRQELERSVASFRRRRNGS